VYLHIQNIIMASCHFIWSTASHFQRSSFHNKHQCH